MPLLKTNLKSLQVTTLKTIFEKAYIPAAGGICDIEISFALRPDPDTPPEVLRVWMPPTADIGGVFVETSDLLPEDLQRIALRILREGTQKE